MEKNLFSEFPPVSKTEWLAKIKEDLKGADYEKKLVWQSLENIRIQPFYTREDLEKNIPLPGEFPFIRGNKNGPAKWRIRQDILVDDISAANLKAHSIKNGGVSSIGFIIPQNKVSTARQTDELLNGLTDGSVEINLECHYRPAEIFSLFCSSVKNAGIPKEKISGCFEYDPLGYLTEYGRPISEVTDDFRILGNLITISEEHLPFYRVISVHGDLFTDAGAGITQELALTLAMAVEYISRLTDMGFKSDMISRHIHITLGIGTSYFMEIAKIRAARYLWSMIISNYGVTEESAKLTIQSVTSTWNQTLYDTYTNILRATTESMSAITGGTDILLVRPFNQSCGPATEFAERISRNIQNILGEEAYMGHVADPAGGSYYIEKLTEAIAEESWKIFLKIEKEGGYLEALKKGIIRKNIEETAEQRRNAVANRREVLIGTNQYPNNKELILKDLKIDIDIPKNAGPDEIISLRRIRASHDFEALRLATEKYFKRPVVFMLTIGDLTMRRARANFSCNFFACAGYQVIDNNGFATIHEGIDIALKAKADIIVLCSSDDEYAIYGPEAVNILKGEKILVVAGAPKNMDELRSAGIENFIHIRSNVLDTLKDFHHKLGITI